MCASSHSQKQPGARCITLERPTPPTSTVPSTVSECNFITAVPPFAGIELGVLTLVDSRRRIATLELLSVSRRPADGTGATCGCSILAVAARDAPSDEVRGHRRDARRATGSAIFRVFLAHVRRAALGPRGLGEAPKARGRAARCPGGLRGARDAPSPATLAKIVQSLSCRLPLHPSPRHPNGRDPHMPILARRRRVRLRRHRPRPPPPVPPSLPCRRCFRLRRRPRLLLRRLLSHRLPLPSPPYLRARPWQVHLTLGAPSPASAGASPMLPRAQMVQTINVAA